MITRSHRCRSSQLSEATQGGWRGLVGCALLLSGCIRLGFVDVDLGPTRDEDGVLDADEPSAADSGRQVGADADADGGDLDDGDGEPRPGDTLGDGDAGSGDGGADDSSGDGDGEPVLDTWSGLGGSELASRSTRVAFGSGAGGGISATSTRSEQMSCTLASDGAPIVAWVEVPEPDTVRPVMARVFRAGAWQIIGDSRFGVSGASQIAQTPVVAAATTGEILFAWGDYVAGEIRLGLWNGTSLVEVGGSLSGGGVSGTGAVSTRPTAAVAASGRIYVAWQEGSAGNEEIFLRYSDGGAWLELDGSASPGGLSHTTGASTEPRLALDENGNPVVAWTDSTVGRAAVYVRRWSGGAWIEVEAGSASGTGVSRSAGNAQAPAVAVDSAGRIAVAWQDSTAGASQIYLKRQTPSGFIELGGSASNGGISGSSAGAGMAALGIDSDDSVVVAWAEQTAIPSAIFARRYRDAAGVWEELAASAQGRGLSPALTYANLPCVATQGSLQPFVAWQALVEANDDIFGLRFDGGAWRSLGIESVSSGGLVAGPALRPSIALDSQGWPAVAWQDASTGVREIYLLRYNGSAYEELGGSASGAGIGPYAYAASQSSALTFDTDGNPVVAFQSIESGNDEVVLWKWAPSGWTSLGVSGSAAGISNSSGWSGLPALALVAGTRPVVAWTETTAGGNEVWLRAWSGTAWDELASSASGAGVSGSPGVEAKGAALAVDGSGRIIVAWEDAASGVPSIYVRRFADGAFAELAGSASGGGVSGGVEAAHAPALTIDAAGMPVLAWLNESGGGADVYLRVWSGTDWVARGGSASGAGVSATGAARGRPALARGAFGQIYVAWSDASEGSEEIYLRAWDGLAFSEVDGSASRGGISNSAAPSTAPALATGGARVCVAWQEPARNVLTVLWRCADE